MGLAHSPSVVTDGLVLSLDASSPKNYNVGVSTNWTDRVGGNNGTLVGGTYHNDGPFVGAGYVEFDGTGDYLTTATHASDFNFGTGDFTIEFWINSTQTSRADPFAWNFDYNTTGWGSFILNVSSGRIDWYEGLGIATYATSTGWNDGLWHHLAVSRSGTSLKVFLDGVQIGTTASSSYSYGASDVGVSVGFSTSTGYYLNGQMSNVRIVKGTALYTSNFTPPTKSLTDISNTKLLTCQGNTIADASSSAHTITTEGDAAANLGFPASAFEFDGTNDYVSIASSSDFNLGTGDFTVECFVYLQDITSNSGYVGIVNRHYYDGNTGWGIWKETGGKFGFWYNAATKINGTSNVAINQWYHIAAVRNGSTISLYVNGVLENSGSNSSFTDASTQLNIGIANAGGAWNAAYPLNGKVSNLRIYKGKGLTAAEVTQNFNAFKGRYA